MVYTPVVGLACQQFSHIYRRPRGLFVSYPLRDSIPTLLRARPNRDIDVLVVTDGERILGIGDQGAGGLGIPIGKLSLYTLIGGIRPERTLPIVLDVGTNNTERLQDPEYLGWRHERITGQEYFDFVDQFVQAVKQELPTTCLHWEDFATPHARPILDRYRDATGPWDRTRLWIEALAGIAAEAPKEHARMILQDVRYALRMLRKHALVTTTIVVTLAVGIGVNTAIFSLLNAVVLRTLPVPAPDHMFVLRGPSIL